MNAQSNPRADRALATVGLSVRQVRELAGAILEAGDAHLVGSLACGFGNAGSDVDIHVFAKDISEDTPPFLCFAGSTPVDIEHFDIDRFRAAVEQLSAVDVMTTPFGAVARSRGVGRRRRRALARWATAVPLLVGQDQLLDAPAVSKMAAVLVRTALDELIRTIASAELAEAALPAGQQVYLWQRCGRQLLELRTRGRGELGTGEKWLPARAHRAGFDDELAGRHYRVCSGEALDDLLAESGLSRHMAGLVTVSEAPGVEDVKLGRQRRVLTPHGRLLNGDRWAHGATAITELDAARRTEAFNGLREGMLVLNLDTPELLEGVCSRD